MSNANKKERLTFIDETRALAIMSMIIAHFGPGVFQRLQSLDFLAEPVLFLGRFATTTFIVVFGVTLGFVYFSRFQNGDQQRISSALWKRSRLLALCSLIICIPNYINLAIQGDWDLHHWMFSTYSILNYYTLALLSVPLWLKAIGKNTLVRCLLLGVAHWSVGAFILSVWHLDPSLGVIEYLRMHLVSGPYGYLQMSGTAILSIPVGIAIREATSASRESISASVQPVLRRLLPLGAMLALAGWLTGLYLDEFSISAIVEGSVKTPARAWYFLFFGGFAFILLAAMGMLGKALGSYSQMLYPLSLFGQASLGIYTGHRFVLPSLGWMDEAGLAIEGILRIALPFALFGIFCAAMMIRQHWLLTKKKQKQSQPERQFRQESTESDLGACTLGTTPQQVEAQQVEAIRNAALELSGEIHDEVGEHETHSDHAISSGSAS